jgi:hypothetical protein
VAADRPALLPYRDGTTAITRKLPFALSFQSKVPSSRVVVSPSFVQPPPSLET